MKYLPITPRRPSQRLFFFGFNLLDSLSAIITFNAISYLAYTFVLTSAWPHSFTRGLASIALGLFAARVVIGTPAQPRKEGRPARSTGVQLSVSGIATECASDAYEKFHTKVIRCSSAMTTAHPRQDIPEHVEVLIIGASALGISTASILRNKYGMDSRSLAILDKNFLSGDNWRMRYKRVTLHDVADLTSLPFNRIPDEFPVWIDHRDYADYQDKYMEDMNLWSVMYPGCEVLKGEEIDDGKRWRIEYQLQGGEIRSITCRVVITCPGDCNEPVYPKIDGLETFPGRVLHTAKYSAASEFVGQKVLIVGFGKSGSEIALDLWEQGCDVSILYRGVVAQVPRPAAKFLQYCGLRYPWLRYCLPWDFILANILLMAWIWATWGDLKKAKIRLDPFGPKFYPIRTWWKGNFRVPAIDVGTVDLIVGKKVKIYDSEIKKVEGSTVHLVNGEKINGCDSIILATGFKMSKIPGIDTVDGGGAAFKVTPGKGLAIYFHGNLFWGVRCVYMGVEHLAKGLGLLPLTWNMNREHWILLSMIAFITWNCIVWNVTGIWTNLPWLRLIVLIPILMFNAFTIVSEDTHWMYP